MMACIDLSEYTVEELTELYKNIEKELKKREEEDTRNCLVAMSKLICKLSKFCDNPAFEAWADDFDNVKYQIIGE